MRREFANLKSIPLTKNFNTSGDTLSSEVFFLFEKRYTNTMIETPHNVKEISALLKLASFEELPALLERYGEDPRKQVQRSVVSAQKRYDKESSERVRVEGMYELMHKLSPHGIALGIDEVGRGSVAGPLTVCALALPDTPIIYGLNDSKKLSASKREELAQEIAKHALYIGIAHIEPEKIDAAGMGASLHVAMQRAIKDAGVEPDYVLLDGNPMHIHDKEINIINGDAKLACIAAASIVAKVTRDRIMDLADAEYPGYGFSHCKGYASAEHIKAIQELGLSDYHRKSFCTGFLPQEKLF